MNYCTSYHQYETYRNKVQELRFPSNVINSALNFIQNHQEHRVWLEVKDINDCGVPKDKLIQLVKENKQLYLDFYRLNDIQYVSEEIPGRYMYHYPVNMWELVQILINYKVSDILLGAPLTFRMNTVKTYVRDLHNIKIRVCPHLGTFRHLPLELDGIESFWILPQHMHLYEGYVDVCDILDPDIVRESTLIDVYLKEEYNHSLALLIENIKSNIKAAEIDENIAKIRMNCEQKCMIHSSLCHSCDIRIRTASKLKEIINKPKEES